MAHKTTMTEGMYQILVRPIVTEKTAAQAENGHVVFEVCKTATKAQIKAAIETLYKVKVEKVNTLTTEGKIKRFRGIAGKRSDVKKAYVHLADGQNLDMSSAV